MDNVKWCLERSEVKDSRVFDDQNSYLITAIAKKSPGSFLGLEPGDYLVKINDNSPAVLEPSELLTPGDVKVNYIFYDVSDEKLIYITTNGIPLGLATKPSSNGIVHNIRLNRSSSWDDFETLWQREEWDLLIEACDLFAPKNTFGKLLSKIGKKNDASAISLFHGTALYEKGDEKKGISLITDFINGSIQQYETSTQAIAYYYAAIWAKKNRDPENSEYWFNEANRYNSNVHAKISQAILERGGEIFSSHQWLNKTFPEFYNLVNLDTSENVSLSDTLKTMNDEEILPVCVMPYYRGNGPYNQSMGCYGLIYKHVSDKIRPIHIIIDETEKRKDRPYWYENEDKLKNINVPFLLLHDEIKSVADTLDLEVSPVFYLLNNKGTILYDGELKDDFDYWNTLSTIQA